MDTPRDCSIKTRKKINGNRLATTNKINPPHDIKKKKQPKKVYRLIYIQNIELFRFFANILIAFFLSLSLFTHVKLFQH